MSFEEITENIDKILSDNGVRSSDPARLRTDILSLVVKAQIEAFVGGLNGVGMLGKTTCVDLSGILPELENE